jgi:hypothetical protein
MLVRGFAYGKIRGLQRFLDSEWAELKSLQGRQNCTVS